MISRCRSLFPSRRGCLMLRLLPLTALAFVIMIIPALLLSSWFAPVMCEVEIPEPKYSPHAGHYHAADGLFEVFWNAVPQQFRNFVFSNTDLRYHYKPWLWSILASVAIGLSGVLPILVIPIEAGASLKQGAAAKTLRLLLSFAVGGLLGDVFLHLLPEAWHHMGSDNKHSGHTAIGMWVLAGVFVFIVVEMMFEKENENSDCLSHGVSHTNCSDLNGIQKYSSSENYSESNQHSGPNNNGPVYKIYSHMNNGYFSPSPSKTECSESQNCHSLIQHEAASRNVAGYLNLLANSIDNFAHGLAVAGSFLVNFKVGMLTTFAILIHEIPHEIGDFAILLKSGFNRCDAAKAQIATAAVGLAGALAALSAESAQTLGDKTAWILPFTAGGFLNIALVNVLPDILQESDPRESIKQLGCIIAGIGVMGLVTVSFG